MSLTLIHATPTDPRKAVPFPGLSPAGEVREANRLRALLNRWKYHQYTIRDDDGSAICTVDLRTLVGVECTSTPESLPTCGKSAATGEG